MRWTVLAPPYDCRVTVMATGNLDEDVRWVRKRLSLNDATAADLRKAWQRKHTGATTSMLDGIGPVIRFQKPVKRASDHGLFVHEMYHAVRFIMRYVGMGDGEDAEEAHAYLLGYLCRDAFSRLWR
jgi:hypothetical protein